MSTLRARGAEISREKILDAAETLFIEKGFNATSLRQVAEVAEVAKSLIFHHFKTKAELWEQVKMRRLADFAERQQQAFSQPAVSMNHFTDAIREYFLLLKGDPRLVRLLIRNKLESEPEGQSFDVALATDFIQRLERAQAAGLLRADIAPQFVMCLILAATNHWFEARHKFCEWPGIDGDGSCDEEYLDTFIDILLNGTLPRQESAS